MNSTLSREKICELTAHKLAAAAPKLPSLKAVVGLDGFVDEIIAVVDKRHDGGKFEPIKTIDRFGAKITEIVRRRGLRGPSWLHLARMRTQGAG